jgi:peroxiredoxin
MDDERQTDESRHGAPMMSSPSGPTAPEDARTSAAGLVATLIPRLDPPGDFNFRHFRMRHMAAELLRTARTDATLLGQMAPDFEHETTTGETLRLRELRGAPVLLHFVSYTCPVTRGGVRAMEELHRRYGDRVRFVNVLVRQAHPGECRGAYRSYGDKLEDAREYGGIAWPVAVDDLHGTVQRAYGGLAAAVFLIDAEGRVAFYGIWGQAPALRAAIDDLLARGGAGAPAGRGIDRVPHLGAAIVAGQGGPARGGWVALLDLELGFRAPSRS